MSLNPLAVHAATTRNVSTPLVHMTLSLLCTGYDWHECCLFLYRVLCMVGEKLLLTLI